MITILKLFGRSPFAPLKAHMHQVASCVALLKPLFEALEKADMVNLEDVSERICVLEHAADLIKNDIRNHLPKSLFLPIDRGHILEILALQDEIADAAEDIAVLATLKPLKMVDAFRDDLNAFLAINIEAFDGVVLIINEMHELLESSFGGLEAERVRSMIDYVAAKEHEVDVFQRKLLKFLFQAEDLMPYTTFVLWQKILEAIAAISNSSEKLAYRIRMTLEIK